MSGYVDAVLGKGEAVLYRGQISLASYWLNFVIGAFLLLPGIAGTVVLMFPSLSPGNSDSSVITGMVIVGLIPVIFPILSWLTTELVITNRRIIAKFGVMRRSTVEINLSKIESIRVEQSIMGRLIGYGDIFIIGTGGSREPIPRISFPLEFRRKYDEILSTQAG